MQSVSNPSLIRLYLETDKCPSLISVSNSDFSCSDSRASINLMPLSVVKRQSFGELTPTTMTLEMADRTLAQLEGILEDVLIKVGD